MTDQPAPWKPPAPTAIPDMRLHMSQLVTGPVNITSLGSAVLAGNAVALPWAAVATRDAMAVGMAMASGEHERLTNAHMYYVTPDMCAVSNAIATTAPRDGFDPSVPPSPYGFMVFGEPIAAYERHLTDGVGHLSGLGFDPNPDITVDIPIVAVTWGPVNAPAVAAQGMWAVLPPGAKGRPVHPGKHTGTWITFYTPTENRYGHLPGSTVVVHVQGRPVTAREMTRATQQAAGPLSWENEIIVLAGDPIVPSDEHTDESPFRWLGAVYAAWQLMRQEGHAKRSLTASEYVPRPRAGARRDTRARIDPATSAVRIVDVHHRPSAAARAADTADTNGRRPTEWKHRWQVPPYWRNTCLNPRQHSNGGCDHEDMIVPHHVKGPAGLPVKPLSTVRRLGTPGERTR